MSERRPEVADVFRRHGPRFLEDFPESVSQEQRRVLRDLSQCRTAALGGHKLRCDACGHEEISYNSCRNRHCPKCQAQATADWLAREAASLLEVDYFHLVFTLPGKLGSLTLQNKRLLYGTLFRVASQTLLSIARDPKHLGAEVGFLAVLHTWGQNLHLHPHLHCVVPAGGLSPDGKRWISPKKRKKKFFLPVKVLSRRFRAKFLDSLALLYKQGKLVLSGKLAFLREASNWKEFLASLRETEWVVHAKPPWGGSEAVLKYLARYTHRVAISNRRLLSIDDGKVTFSWKDYADGAKRKVMTLKANEFIRRFLLHILPKGFVRIRHYGFLANRVRAERIPLARKLLGQTHSEALPDNAVTADVDEELQRKDEAIRCPHCKQGRLAVVEVLQATREIPFEDTS